MGKNMEELQRRLHEAGSDPASLGKIFKEMGISR